MSSHHFVKEQQEPALLILDASSSFETISPLLEWSPTVLVAEGSIDVVLSWGIKIDVILASADYQKNNLHLLEEQYPVKFMSVSDGKFLEEGLHFLVASKHSAVNVLGFDHAKIFDLEPMVQLMDIVIIDGPIRYFPVKQGEFRKWYGGVYVQLHAKEGTMVEVKSGEMSQFIKIKQATFVEVKGQVSFHSPDLFWIGESLVDI